MTVIEIIQRCDESIKISITLRKTNKQGKTYLSIIWEGDSWTYCSDTSTQRKKLSKYDDMKADWYLTKDGISVDILE